MPIVFIQQFITQQIKMHIKPLGDKIIIKKSHVENVTSFGLVIPTESDKPDQGIVFAVGRDAKHVKAGDMVAFAKRMGQPIKLDDGEVLLMSETCVMGVL